MNLANNLDFLIGILLFLFFFVGLAVEYFGIVNVVIKIYKGRRKSRRTKRNKNADVF